jgi:hypothetical protein
MGGSEFVVRHKQNKLGNLIEIVYHYSYNLPPFRRLNNSPIMTDEDSNSPVSIKPTRPATPGGLTINLGDRFGMDATGFTGRSTDMRHFVALDAGLSFTKGCGEVFFQIDSSTDNGLGGGNTATNNGVGISLYFGTGQNFNELGNDTPDRNKVDAEVYFNRKGAPYSFIQQRGDGRLASAVNPLKVEDGDGDVNSHKDHDYMGISIQNGFVSGFVIQDNGLGRQQLFTTRLTDEQKLAIGKKGIQCIIYFNDDENAILVQNCRINISPYHLRFDGADESGPYEDDYILHTRFTTDIPLLLMNTVPNLLAGHRTRSTIRVAGLTDGPRQSTRILNNDTIQINIPREVLEYLGFKNRQNFSKDRVFDVENGIFRLIADFDSADVFSDYYVVESQSLQLDSYNAMPDNRLSDALPVRQSSVAPLKGDRRSILATVPQMDNITGSVAFETNTPIFIDIKNISDTNIRNLKFRVLDKNMNEIETANISNMTILIED